MSENQRPPEPPERYAQHDYSNGQVPQGPQNTNTPDKDFISIRRFITAAQVIALVSLFIGGVLLSAVAIIIAAIARSRAAESARNHQGESLWQSLNRSAFIAIVMSVLALVLNAVSLFFLYPMVMDMMQTGDYASLFGMNEAQSGSGSSTWG